MPETQNFELIGSPSATALLTEESSSVTISLTMDAPPGRFLSVYCRVADEEKFLGKWRPEKSVFHAQLPKGASALMLKEHYQTVSQGVIPVASTFAPEPLLARLAAYGLRFLPFDENHPIIVGGAIAVFLKQHLQKPAYLTVGRPCLPILAVPFRIGAEPIPLFPISSHLYCCCESDGQALSLIGLDLTSGRLFSVYIKQKPV